jgi:hypothetical protein
MSGRTDNQDVGSEAATIERVRNSSLVKCSGADNGAGLKRTTETVGVVRYELWVLSHEDSELITHNS